MTVLRSVYGFARSSCPLPSSPRYRHPMFVLSVSKDATFPSPRLSLDWSMLSMLSVVPTMGDLQRSLIECCDWSTLATFLHPRCVASQGTPPLQAEVNLVKNILGVEGFGRDQTLSRADYEAYALHLQLSRILLYVKPLTKLHADSSLANLAQLLSRALDDFDDFLLESRILRLPAELHLALWKLHIAERMHAFRDLRVLRSASDVLFLRSMVTSRLSREVKHVIDKVSVHDESGMPAVKPTEVGHLLRYLPSVSEIIYGRSSTRYNSAMPWNSNSLLSWRYSLHKLQRLRVLALHHHEFPSLSALLRLIGSVPELQKLHLERVFWPTPLHWDQYLLLNRCPKGTLNISFKSCSASYQFWIAAISGYQGEARVRANQPFMNVLGHVKLLMWLYEAYLRRCFGEGTGGKALSLRISSKYLLKFNPDCFAQLKTISECKHG